MKRGLFYFWVALLTCSAQNVDQAAISDFNSKPWLEDFQQILSEMSAHYANLEWAVEDRKMDLPQLRRETESKLREAPDDAAAHRVLDKFLASFGDGHLEIEWPKANSRPKSAAGPPQSLCERMGYTPHLHPGLNFSGFPEFSPVRAEEDLFPGGLLRLQNWPTLGLLRIALSSEHSYPEFCRQAAQELHLAEDAECDEKCDDRLEIATANLLTAALARRAAELKAAGATALIIDITQNGGGSDWVEAASRVLSSVPLRDSRMGFLKHEHWTKELEDQLRDIRTEGATGANSAVMLESAANLEKAIVASKQRCDATAVWDTGKLPCSLLVKGFLFTAQGESLPESGSSKSGAVDSHASESVMFQPSHYVYAINPKALPLYVVVDRNTWSAAEYFAALMQDNHAATIVGEVTGGAGCGYTDGGIPAKLKNSRAQLKMPDCVRFRADGSNEVNGITPDILLPWAGHDSDYQRAKKLFAALQARTAAVR